LAFYVLAMLAVCWHFAYGVWLFAAKWGITPGETARRRFGWVCIAGGIVLAAMGLAGIWAFVGPGYQNAPENVPVSTLIVPAASAPDYVAFSQKLEASS
jgi:succinate dehydrogenase / fumarate reductase cytochrome b subunit